MKYWKFRRRGSEMPLEGIHPGEDEAAARQQAAEAHNDPSYLDPGSVICEPYIPPKEAD